MSAFAIAIFTILMGLQPNLKDKESLPEREARMETMARAIASVASEQEFLPKEVSAAALLSLGWHETRFSQSDHEGKCSRKDGCDKARSKTNFQIWQGKWIPKTDQVNMVGTSYAQTRLAVAWANLIFRQSYRHCKKGLLGAFSVYATGNNCDWEGSALRRTTLFSFQMQISKILKSSDVLAYFGDSFRSAQTLEGSSLKKQMVALYFRAIRANRRVSVRIALRAHRHAQQGGCAAAKTAVNSVSRCHFCGV